MKSKVKLQAKPVKREVSFDYGDYFIEFSYEDNKLYGVFLRKYSHYVSHSMRFDSIEDMDTLVATVKEAYNKQLAID